MMSQDLSRAVDRLGDMIASASTIVPFTGAGISTECGIPDFRSPGGLWSKHRPIPYDQFVADQDARNEAWKRRFAMAPVFEAAQPGRGHLAIAALYKAGKVPGVITQNIDNLHQKSGVAATDVIELHGNTSFARCIGCAKRFEISWVRDRFEKSGGIAPVCTDCEEPIKTATISFGEAMPEAAMQRANELAQGCELLIAIGSSLVVWPAASFPLVAKRSGAKLIIVNNEPTEQDQYADLIIHHDIGETFGPFIGN